MPFVPLSTDGTQRATTETLRAPRVQVALEPHEAGVTVLAIEPTGLRSIGQLDLAVADGYRRVLAPLAADGVYGICIAEQAGDGTALSLAPASRCLPAGDRPWRPDPADTAGTPALAAWRGGAGDEPRPADATTVPAAAAGAAPAEPVRRPAHRPRPPADRRAAAPWVLAGVIALLMVGAVTQALTGGTTASPTSLAAAEFGSVPVPAWTPGPASAELPPVVEAAPVAVTEPAEERAPVPAAAPRAVAPAPAPAAPPRAEPDDHADDDHASGGDSPDSASSDSSDSSGKPGGSSKPSSSAEPHGSDGPSGSSKPSGGSGQDAGKDSDDRPDRRRLPSFSDLLGRLHDQHSGSDDRPRFGLPRLGR